MKEADVQKWVKEKLLEEFTQNIYLFKVPQGQYTSRRGIPDLVASILGLFVAIEVKMPAGTLTALQQHEIVKIEKAGGLSFVIYGKDEMMLKLIIREIRKVVS